MRDFSLGIIGNLLASLIWQVAIVLAPTLFGVAVVVVGTANSPWVPIIFALGWSASTLASVILYKSHKEHAFQRTLDFASIMRILGHTRSEPMPEDLRHVYSQEFRDKVNKALLLMRGLLAYRIPYTKKGATFLLLRGTEENAPFEVFDQVGHDDPRIPYEVHQQLSKSKGLAAEALKTGSCVVLYDCRRPPKGSSWVDTHNPPRFCGRAAAPVQIYVNNKLNSIGVLCFDVRIPYKLTKEEQSLMLEIADRIAELWKYQGILHYNQ